MFTIGISVGSTVTTLAGLGLQPIAFPALVLYFSPVVIILPFFLYLYYKKP